MAKVGILGASGFTGAELMRLLAGHPTFEVALVAGESQAGTPVSDLYPSLAAAYGGLRYEAWQPELADGLDLVFCALPHGTSQSLVPELLGRVAHIVDLAADFRLHDPALYPEWYEAAHAAPELLDRFAYGLPELFRDDIAAADHVAVPGCYPTAAAIALAPLVRGGVVESDGLIVDAASGVSGSGRAPRANTTFCAVDEDFAAYGMLTHRHTPEIEQALGGATVIFTPHLAPMNRGILATCYARPTASASAEGALTSERVQEALEDAYDDEPFVVVSDTPPHTKATLGANTAQVHGVYDDRTGLVVALAAIDNLVKGASGQAIQCANLLCGLDETVGLPTIGLAP